MLTIRLRVKSQYILTFSSWLSLIKQFNSDLSLKESCRVLIKGTFILLSKCSECDRMLHCVLVINYVSIFPEYCVQHRAKVSLSPSLSSIYCVSDVNTSLSSAVPLISVLRYLLRLTFSLCVCLCFIALFYSTLVCVFVFPFIPVFYLTVFVMLFQRTWI